jgi:hypothetical protein
VTPQETAEQAWQALAAAERDFPGCEHVRAWQRRVEQARAAHRAALRELDRAAFETPPLEHSAPVVVRVPAPLELEHSAPRLEQVPLFDLEDPASREAA